MNKSKVRCWKLEHWVGKAAPNIIYISYPENDSGHDLLSCLRCGHVYAASVVHQIYVGPELAVKLAQTPCVDCGANLAETAKPYPEMYRWGGEILEFERPLEIPADSESEVKEFDEIYQ